MNKPIFINTDQGLKRVGELIDTTLYKVVDPKNHYLRSIRGYAVQKSILDNNEISEVVIKEKGGRVLKSNIAMWEDHGIRWDMGWGEQVALPEKYMSETK